MKTINFWFGIIGVIGVCWGIYTYFEQRRVGIVSYQIQTQKVFDPSDLKNFKLITEQGTPVDKKIYATDVIIWNSGDLSLSENSDRIREPLKLTIVGEGQLFYFIEGTIKPTKENFSFKLLPGEKSYEVRWRFLDPGDGFRLTLVHSGSDSTKVQVEGRFFETSFMNEVLRGEASYLIWAYIIGSTVGGILAGSMMLDSFRQPDSWFDRIFSTGFFLLVCFVIFVMIYSKIHFHIPPF
jgi:hypothetical protein